MKSAAVIDLGTNTFHLLHASFQENELQEIFRERHYVRLAEQSIKFIGKDSFNRAILAMESFAHYLNEHQIRNYRAVGTAAMRRATNAQELVYKIGEKTGIQVEVIPGGEEADLIAKGIQMAMKPKNDTYLVMDIGGGSTEFILVKNGKILFTNSYPLGAAVLKNKYQDGDPISKLNRQKLRDYVISVITPLIDICSTERIDYLVGSAGTFDALVDIEFGVKRDKRPTFPLSIAQFERSYEKIVPATMAERYNIPGLPIERADMIGVAMILIQAMFQEIKIPKIFQSDYALKEGVLHSLLIA